MTTIPSDSRQLSPAKLALLHQRLRGAGARAASGVPRRPQGARVPRPPAQHARRVVDQCLPDNAMYSVNRGLWLRGRLDVNALRASLDEVVRRHDILRTTYVGGTEPEQVVGPVTGAALQIVPA